MYKHLLSGFETKCSHTLTQSHLFSLYCDTKAYISYNEIGETTRRLKQRHI